MKLLAPGGIVIITESTENGSLMYATTAFFENGFVQFENKRHGRPLLSVKEWTAVFENAGSLGIDVFPHTGDEWFGQYIMVFGAPDKLKVTDKNKVLDTAKSVLPEYMVPSYCSVLEKLPLTANGKVNRKALQTIAARLSNYALNNHKKAEIIEMTETEKNVTAAWCECLEIEQADLEDDFFTDGGDSLIMVKLIQLLADNYDYEVTMGCVFSGPTIKEIAAAIDNGTSKDE